MSEGLRKRRTHYFVQVPRDTIRDGNLSFRARGLLSFLLDQAEGFDVRSEFLSSTTKTKQGEGREAIRTALHELAKYGYYRLERRRLRDGRMVMGTSISEEPVESWKADYAEFEGKAVPCVQLTGGGFQVRHTDGSLTSDGFDTDGDDVEPDPTPGGDAESDNYTGAQEPVPGQNSPAPGNPSSGEPASGGPASGSRGAFREKEKGEATRETSTTTSPAPVADAPVEGVLEPMFEDLSESDRIQAVLDNAKPDPFDAFWSVYPRKVGKEDARKAFAKALRNTTVDAVLDGARRFAADPNLPGKDERQFIAHPATWLKRGSWGDEPLPPRIGKKGAINADSGMTQENHDTMSALAEQYQRAVQAEQGDQGRKALPW